MHGNLNHLRACLKNIGPRKSIVTWAEDAARQGGPHLDESIKEANIAVNNTFDVDFYKKFVTDPSSAAEI
ncbi:MAG: hypothetical protein ACK5U4_01935, partial [Rhodospirillales bacterium]